MPRQHAPVGSSPSPEVAEALRAPPTMLPTVPWARAQALGQRALWRVRDTLRRAAPWPTLPRPAPDGRAFRILFLVSESGKWTQQLLFDRLAATPGLEVGFALTPSDLALRMRPALRARHHARQHAAFAALGPVRADLLLPGDRLQDLRDLPADLLLLQQPWGLQGAPRHLAGCIPCAHVSYELGVIHDPRQQFALPHFHPWLWRLFVPDSLHLETIRRTPGAIPAERVVLSGSPRLDAWRAQLTGQGGGAVAGGSGPRRVVWAPHHSLSPRSLRLGTFDWSGPAMLQLARTHPELAFVLRPHPNLWAALDGWRPGGSSAFLKDWAALPNTALSQDGDALPVLAGAAALITDSVSFMAEFMLTGRPILRLTRSDATPLSAYGQLLQPCFYPCPDPETLQDSFARVVIAGTDPLRAARVALAARLSPGFGGNTGQDAADRIRDEILRAISLPEIQKPTRSA